MNYRPLTGHRERPDHAAGLERNATRAVLEDIIEVSVELRRKRELPTRPQRPLSRQEMGEQYGAMAEDAEAIVTLAEAHELQVTEYDLESRIISLKGERRNIVRLFPAILRTKDIEGSIYTVLASEISVAAPLYGRVLSVFGLDDEPLVVPYVAAAIASPLVPVAPTTVGGHYGFREGTGQGATIALLEFGGSHEPTDLDLGLSSQSIERRPAVDTFVVGNGSEKPGLSQAHKEVALDLQVAASIAPEANFQVFLSSPSRKDVLACLVKAIYAKPTPTVISMSWGQMESAWTGGSREAFSRRLEEANALGICFFASSGDMGSGNGQPVPSYPATDPNATACGGTEMATPHDFYSEEVAWSDHKGNRATGGGFSPSFPIPIFQGIIRYDDGHGTGMRGIPDVAGYASMQPGYRIFLGGSPMGLGGTSAVAPMYAAFVATVLGERRLTNLNEILYQNRSAFLDIKKGNSRLGSDFGAKAGRGWDACTGLGRAKGEDLARALRNALATQPSEDEA